MFSQRNALAQAVSPVVERLDARRLLAFSTLNAGGTLSVVGTAGNDGISVERKGANILVKRNGVTETHLASKVRRVWASGFGGNDAINIKTNLRATLLGESGNDTLTGNASPDKIDGGSGADHLYAGGGNDTCIGGLHSDVIKAGDGDDVLYGDELTGGNGSKNAGRDSLYGENGNDTFYNGSDGADRYDGGAGNDRFEQIPDNDLLADGGDTFIGGPGNDSITYAARQVSLRITLDNVANDGAAGEKDDVRSDVENITGGEEPDYIVGSSAGNVIDAGPVYFDLDTIFGGAGNDTLTGGILDGGLGNDVMEGGVYDYSSRTANLTFTYDADLGVYAGGQAGEKDTFYFSFFYENELLLGSGHDKVTGVRGFIVRGGNGNDTLTGAIDDDFGSGNAFYGDAGNDRLTTTSYAYIEGGLGNDTMSTGQAVDSTLAFEYTTSPVLISYDGNNANDGPVNERDVIALDTFEAVIGGGGNDVFVGNDLANFFIGGGGNDSLVGRGGDDTLDGEAGADTLDGGLGDDFFYGGDDRDTVDYSGRTRNLTININAASRGNGEAGEDDYFAGDIEVVLGGRGHDKITGNARNNTIYGGAGNDTLRGGAGNDVLSGDGGNDRHYGEAGNDIIYARDSLIDVVDGGNGQDKAAYDTSPLADVVTSIETKL